MADSVEIYFETETDVQSSGELEDMMMSLLDFEETEDLLEMAEMDLFQEQQMQQEIESQSPQRQRQAAYAQEVDPFWGFFNSPSSSFSKPTVILLEVEDLSQPSVYADELELKKLEKRVQDLEVSNALLVAGFDTNADAFWGVCTADVLGLCDTASLQDMSCVYEQTEVAVQCLADNINDVQSSDCLLGVQRMASWLSANSNAQQYPGSAHSLGRAHVDYYQTNPMSFLIHFLLFFMIFFCVIRCCAACVGMRRRAALRRRLAMSKQAKPAAPVSPPTTASLASPCERGEIVRGTKLAGGRNMRNITVQGVPVDVQVEDGKHYL